MLPIVSEESEIHLHDGSLKGQDLNRFLNIDMPGTFLFDMKSDAMSDAAIYKGDVVVCRRDIIPSPHDIVVAVHQGRFVMRIWRNDPVPSLVTAAGDETIDLRFNPSCHIIGVVVGIMRRLRQGM